MKSNKTFPVITFETLPSTNDHARELAQQGTVEEGTLVYTPFQTQGRGQRSTQWFSESGASLTFSMVCYPQFLKASRQFYLTQAVSLGILEGFRALTGKAGFAVKWPNDIYFNDQKLGGVLIESSLSKDKISSAVVGIGLNLNQEHFPEALPNPVSLHLVTGFKYEPETVMLKLAEWIWHFYTMLREGQLQALKSLYEKELYLLNELHRFQLAEGGEISGKIRGVDEDGMLKIEMKNGHIQKFDFKAITVFVN